MESSLDPALPTRYVTMVGVRDTDPLEQGTLDRSDVEHITVEQVRRLSPAIDLEMEHLGVLTDVIYLYVDLNTVIPDVVQRYTEDVRASKFPTKKQSFR
jgi:hypothetical protein